MPQLYALYIPRLFRDAAADRVNELELAHQVLDIITIRPDIRLRYLAIGDRCWEFLESLSDNRGVTQGVADAGVTSDEDDEHGDDDVNDVTTDLSHEDEEEGDANDGDDDTQDQEQDDSSSSESDVSEWSIEDEKPSRPHIRLQSIFFQDVVSIFKARHREL